MVNSAMARPFLIAALNHGVAVEPFLAPSGTTYDEVQNGEGLLSGQHWYDLVESIAVSVNDPYLGFRVGTETAMDAFPNLEILRPQDATVGELLTAMVIDAGRVTSLARYSLEVDGPVARLSATRTFKPSSPPGQIDGLFTGFVSRLLRMAFGDTWASDALKVWVCVPGAVPLSGKNRMNVVKGNLKGARFEFPSEWLLTRFSGIQQQPVFGHTEDSADFLAQVHRLLDLHLHEPTLSLDRFADMASRSVGQMKRAFSANGTSFRDKLNERRRARAIALVTNSDLPLRAVGERVGFPEPTGFNRVFKRWTGVSPGRFRDHNREAEK